MMEELNNVRVESFYFNKDIYLLGGELANVRFKEARLIKKLENESEKKIGELVGYVDIVYPFVGLNLNLTLEIYNEMVDENLNIIDGVIKIPFTANKLPMHDLFYERDLFYDREMLDDAELFRIDMDLTYDKCSCGGYMMPMYDEFPNWIKFCTNCDSRNENTGSSPIVEPLC